MQTPKKIAVVGSGLVGSLLAIYLKKAGHSVHVYDRSPDIRKVAFSGRSINLVMSTRGWKTLEDIGLDEAVRAIGIPVDKRAIHLGTSAINYQYYGKEGEAIFSLSRGILNRKMIDLAEEAGVEFFFEQKIWDVTLPMPPCMLAKPKEGSGKNSNMIWYLVQTVLFRVFVTACNAKACLIIHKNFYSWATKNCIYPPMLTAVIKLIKTLYTFGLEEILC